MALERPYEEWVEQYGERCGICGRAPSERRKLDRDHWHWGPKAGEPRGLLCWYCNKTLTLRLEKLGVPWLLSTARYLDGGL